MFIPAFFSPPRHKDTKKGKKTWEVKIKGNDGKKWEVYYDIKTGELVAEEAD